MSRIPDYIGVSAFGVKMGVVVPGSNVPDMALEALTRCCQDDLLDDGDTVCITESVVARAQNNFVTLEDIAADVRLKLQLKEDSRLGIVFPILSRNRFSLILKGLAAAVPKGEVIIQLSHPADEVGNELFPDDLAESLGKGYEDTITLEDVKGYQFSHPITEVNYVELYQQIVAEAGAKANIIISNNPTALKEYHPDGIVVASIHSRFKVLRKVEAAGLNAITLQDICSDPKAASWSEWGVLGSNMSAGDRLKLAPRYANELAAEVQARVAKELGKKIEVIVYGDGAYKDPATGIYELADPQPALGMTEGLSGRYREGLKYKYMVDKMYAEGVKYEDIEASLAEAQKKTYSRNSIETEGTTPRKAEDLISSLSDLVSGSADAGTPMVLVKGFLK